MRMPRMQFTLRGTMIAVGVEVPRVLAERRFHQAVSAALDEPVDMPFAPAAPLDDVLNYIRVATTGPDLEDGLAIFIEASAFRDSGDLMRSTIYLKSSGEPLHKSLETIVKQLGQDFSYTISNGSVFIHRGPDRSAWARRHSRR
jgi:hypothetical protein